MSETTLARPVPTASAVGPDAVLWDMDGTLLDSEKIWDVALDDLAAELGGVLSVPTRAAMVGSNMAVSIGLLFEDLGLRPDDDERLRAGRWLRDHTAQLFAEGLPWRPGARETLDVLGAAGVPMALVTNTERHLTERALPTLGAQRFAAVVCGDEVPSGKPAPDPYLRAAGLLGVAPARCLVVEDSPTGAAAARAAGCPTLVVPCAVPVPGAPGRVHRESLEGITVAELSEAWRSASPR
ncbi:HAD family hydrolase [Speluncibacter jeojiensis]|uniref:HAD family hydrolase n=1 Tax=Speluncibacter jeojiensis TaxID=2710754 RepID=UPI00241060EC|nr:HAD family phosphatase [Rhodococcus sp. D2-41]